MRILHLATSLTGGAGIAARRIAESQLELGINVELWSTDNSRTKLTASEKIIKSSEITKFKSKLLTFVQFNFIQKTDFLVTPISLEKLKLEGNQFESFDLINLHASYNLVSLGNLVDSFKEKPLVVTMHDERTFTGGCHYSLGCQKFTTNCNHCPQVRKVFNWLPELTLKNQIAGISDTNLVKFVSPSNWLAEQARSSHMVKGRDVVLIRNPIPKLFSILPIPPQMPPKAIRIAFVSENLLNPYKGFEILVSALNKVPREFEVELILIGRGRIHLTIPNVKVVQKYCTSASEVAIEIGKCSVLVVPSIQDNSPSVISESLMCGIPVIGAAVGGITEILQEFGMPIFPAGDADELASSIVNFQSVNTIETARKAREMFSYENIATQYSNLYASMISNL